MNIRYLALLLVSLTGCANLMPPVPITTKFNSQDHDAYRQTGSATIKGQGFLRQQGGGTVTCAGSPVYALPDTPFFREMVGVAKSGRRIDMPDVDKSVLRESQCDAQGNFAFANMPAARWMLFTEVAWTVRYERQGGYLMKSVYVGSGETIQALLTQSEFFSR